MPSEERSCENCRFNCEYDEEHDTEGKDYPNMPPDYCIEGSLWQPRED